MAVDRATREERLLSSYEHSGVFLFQETHRRLINLAIARGVDAESAADLAQDALVTLFERRPSVNRPEHWLTRIVLRRICDYWRQRQVEQRALDRLSRPEPAAPAIADPIRRRRLARAIQSLPRRSRLLIRSRYFEGRGEAESARMAGYSPASFKKAMTRALARLRSELRSHRPGADPPEDAAAGTDTR